MDLVSLCPFIASTVVWQANSGAFALTVIVKATFVLQPGTAKLASEQDPIVPHDRFYDDDPRRSVRIPSDVVPYKPRADVLLVGHAYAPGKQPVRSLVTRFVVGEMDKSIEVWCDRVFRILDAQLLEGKRFTQLPLVWERASGGPESANPVGKRFDAQPDAYGTIAIANLQPPGHFVSKRSDTFVPTCYAPVAPTWRERTQRLGRLSRSILDTTWHEKPLPVDLDPSFFQAAPPDQNVAEIRANERIVLDNLHPEHPHLVTSLPDLRPRAIADRATGEREEIPLVGDTLLVDTDRGVCCVVWRGRMGLRHPQEAGRIAVWVDAIPMIELGDTPGPSNQLMDAEPDATKTMFGFMPSISGPALPFVQVASSLAQPYAMGTLHTASHDENDGNGTMFVPIGKLAAKAIPFERQGTADSPLEQTMPPLPAWSNPVPFGVPSAPEPPVFFQDPYAKERIPFVEPAIPEHSHVPPDEPEQSKEVVAPPAMIGPLATTDLVKPDIGTEGEKEPSAAKEEKLPLEEYPIDRCGGIAARMAQGKEDRYAILKAENLKEQVWQDLHAHWQSEIKTEAGRGEKELMLAYDRGYVSALERERGPITAEDFKRLVLAMERGKGSETLAEMGLPSGAMMRIRRVRMGRTD